MSLDKISNYVLIVGRNLLRADPSAHGDLQPSLIDEHLNIILHLFGLPGVPHVEVLHFDVSKPHVWIPEELHDDLTENLGDHRMVIFALSTNKVLLVGL
jgi:hypothetical protein